MADPAAPRRPIDVRAVQHIARRLGGANEPPWLHREVARRLAERLPIVRRQPQRVIDASGWSGGGEPFPAPQSRAAQLGGAVPVGAPAAAAPPWWHRLVRRAAAAQPLASGAPWPDQVGLVWSNMVLHAAADPPAEFARWLAALEVDGFVMFSCLGPGTLVELRAIYAAQGWGPPGAAFVDMHDLGDMLVHAGFADPVMDQETLTLTWPNAEAALAECRSLGGNAAPDRRAGCRTPRWRQRLLEALAARTAGAPVGLSFEVVYGHAFRAAPRVRVASETTIPLESMRSLVRSGRARE